MAWSLQAEEFMSLRTISAVVLFFTMQFDTLPNGFRWKIAWAREFWIFCSARHENIIFGGPPSMAIHIGSVASGRSTCFIPDASFSSESSSMTIKLQSKSVVATNIQNIRVQNWCNKPASYAYSSSKEWMSSDIFPKTLLHIEQKRPTQKFS